MANFLKSLFGDENLKKIKAIHFRMNEDAVTSALFIFDDDIIVEN